MEPNDVQGIARALSENRMNSKDKALQDQFERLRKDRKFKALAKLAERGARFEPGNPKLRRLQAQALIDLGQPATAVSVIESVSAKLDNGDPEFPELQGLLGRAYKQMFVESGYGVSAAHKTLLEQAISAYEKAYSADPDRYWHGVNLLALKSLALRKGLAPVSRDELDALAGQVMSAAQSDADSKQDPWAYATVAEASIALEQLPQTEAALKNLLSSPELTSFHVGSLLRQLVQVWQLGERDKEWQGILTMLRAMHAKMPGTDATLLDAQDIKQGDADAADLQDQFERILGQDGLVTFEWWQLAMRRAAGVAAVFNEKDRRIGTAFVVDGQSLLDKWAGKTLALTNFHVVNREGVAKGLRPENAVLVFEAVDANKRYAITDILWESAPHEFDCAVLLLDEAPPASGIAPFARRLPLIDQQSTPRVFIIGHPAGRGLEFSINDNELLDHDEAMKNPVTRVHYRAPTESGSSGSPVFKDGRLEVIAIHHGFTRSKLNNKEGSYEANEGIGLQSLKAMLASIEKDLPDIP